MDHAGRLWIAGNDGGLGRVDAPNDPHPQFAVYDSAHGLGSNSVYCVTEDIWGRIYVGHGRGVDRLDPKPAGLGITPPPTAFLWAAPWSHFAIAPAPSGSVQPTASLVWSRSPMWCAIRPLSCSRVCRSPEWRAGCPNWAKLGSPAYNSVPTNGTYRSILSASAHEPGESLQYEYQLDGDSGGWIQLGDQRRITFANLRSGRYLFSVRATRHRWRAEPRPQPSLSRSCLRTGNGGGLNC